MEIQKCEHCGGKLTGRWEKLSKGLCRTLVKFWQVSGRGKKPMHLLQECSFTTNEVNNFQKLRYFGLVKKTPVTGFWQITDTGQAFVFDSIGIERAVLVFRNEVVERSTDIVPITAIMRTDPYWLQKPDFTPVPMFE